MKKNSSRGFTLIELLVVIAIIGILASVVLASLNTARNKGADAKIKAELANARAQAELFYDTNSSYAGVCNSTTGGIATFKTSTSGTCIDTGGTNWAMSAPLKTTGTWCVDSTGASKSTSGTITATNC